MLQFKTSANTVALQYFITLFLLQIHKMEESTKTESGYKAKISFSIESMLASNKKSSPSPPPDQMSSDEDHIDVDDHYDDEEDERIKVDDDKDELESRESGSPSLSHPVIVPQPLHASMPPSLIATSAHQWPFSWIGHQGALFRPGSPQSKC